MITVYKKPTRHPYNRARVIVSGIDNQADMSSLSKYNKGIPFSLVVINIFFQICMQPLKNKIAKEVVKGFKEILQKGRKC